MHSESHVSGLAERWSRARKAALASVLGLSREEVAAKEEAVLVAVAGESAPEELFRRVFDNSLRLGKGFMLHHGGPVGLEELPGVLGQLGVQCLRGSWRRAEDEPAEFLEREPCQSGASAIGCDYWREACDGLVLGLSGGTRHTRHASSGHGDARCLDVLYVDPESPLRFGLLPDELREALEPTRRLIQRFRGGGDVTFLGVSEGVLLYQLTAGCGGKAPLTELLERCVRARFPNLTLREMSPRGVLDQEPETNPHELEGEHTA
jgi:hypothetical protein